MIAYTHFFIASLIFTVVVETLALLFLLRTFFHYTKDNIHTARILFSGFFASFATIPYVWYVFPNLTNWTRSDSLHYSEIFAVILEALFYRMYLKTSIKNSLLVSLICNALSFSVGRFLILHGLWFY